MKTITPKNKQTITHKASGDSPNMLPRRGPGPAAMRVKGMQTPTGDRNSAKAR